MLVLPCSTGLTRKTGQSFQYELKNGLEFTQKNLNRVIFTTNNKYALKIEPGERRYACVLVT